MRKKRLKKENKISQLTTNILQAIHKTLHFISVEKSSYNRHKCIILWTLSGKQIVLVPIVSADMLQSSRQWTQQTRTLIHRFYGERRQFHCNMLLKECVCVCVLCVCVCSRVCVNQNKEQIHTKDGKSSRTCRAKHKHLERKASESFQWHIESFPSKDVVNSGQ
jgi:hypothetical protein